MRQMGHGKFTATEIDGDITVYEVARSAFGENAEVHLQPITTPLPDGRVLVGQVAVRDSGPFFPASLPDCKKVRELGRRFAAQQRHLREQG